MTADCIDIFVSYDPADEKYLKALEQVLRPFVRLGQVRLWSRRNVIAGDDVADATAQKLGLAPVTVLLLSIDYLANDACYAEAERALDAQKWLGSVIGVVLRPCELPQEERWKRLQLFPPAPGQTIIGLKLPDDGWLAVAAGIVAAARGRVSTLAPAQELPGTRDVYLAPLDLVGEALLEPTLLHPLALGCNRGIQWGTLNQLMTDSTRDDLILLTGEMNQGHGFFLDRISKSLARDPARYIVPVEWDRAPFPASEDEYRADLALALRCTQSALAVTLQRIVLHHNLVLLHRIVDDKFPGSELDAERCLKLFREWLPRLFAPERDVRPAVARPVRRAVKCVQPIAWRPVFVLKTAIARALALLFGKPPAAVESWLDEHRAREFLRRLEDSTSSSFTVHRLVELTYISDEDLREVCKQAKIPAPLWPKFIVDARRRGPTPQELFPGLSRLLRDPALKANS